MCSRDTAAAKQYDRTQRRRRRRRPSCPPSQCLFLLCATVSHAFISVDSFTSSAPLEISRCLRHKDSYGLSCLSVEDSNNFPARFELEEEVPTPSESTTRPSSPRASITSNRRDALLKMAAIPTAALLTSSTLPDPANAAQPELDKSGVLFSPKAKMLGGGGSDAARGIKIRDRTTDTTQQKRSFAKSVGTIQQVYSVRFIAYLSRFILNFDPAARAWWLEEASQMSAKSVGADAATRAEQLRFAEFAESVEVGLADYFVGPYGSYASLEAAKAGMNARAPATSGGIVNEDKSFNFAKLLGFGKKKQISTLEKKQLVMTEVKQKRQGIKNLLTLLKARYTSLGAKNQLAILFSLIDDAGLQPFAEIRGLMGEADNASVTTLELIGNQKGDDDFRMSARRGGGYAVDSHLDVRIEPPPALGKDYRCAKIEPVMKTTSRILKIRVLDGGAGYKTAPTVTVTQKGVKRQCDAVAILDRRGSVESILVLDPGYGYGGNDRRGPTGPVVQLSQPKTNGKQSEAKEASTLVRQATAEAELEYAIKDIKIDDHGSGYSASEPPKITISPCEQDPEWFVSPMTYRAKQGGVAAEDEYLQARVTKMMLGYYNTTVDVCSASSMESCFDTVDDAMIGSVAGDSLSLLPTTVRPQFSPVFDRYIVPDLPPIPEDLSGIGLPSQKYRAIDPIFGGVGSKPVTIGAKELTVSEYTRLALSGAICTVLVRTALNPLELVKTKIQLENDKELLQFAAANMAKAPRPTNKATSSNSPDAVFAVEKSSSKTKEEGDGKIGTLDLITSLVKLRGPLSLFQSADITFLASLVFGSFGFGATELFRRFFTNAIFEEAPSGGTGEELVLLGAAALACVLTSLAATPFEMIRVQSMGKVEAQGWIPVLADYLAEKRLTRDSPRPTFRGGTGALPASASAVAAAGSNEHHADFRLQDINKDDLKPLFSGFAPIVSRELPFAITKFLVFDLLAKTIMSLLNSQGSFTEPVQVGVGPAGLAVSAIAGAVAGIAGAVISHPADLILTLTSSSKEGDESSTKDWRPLVKELIAKDGGVGNLFAGLPARATFFFLVIGLQFFLYDFVKGLFNVSSDDLTLVLDVFYAIRQGLIDS